MARKSNPQMTNNRFSKIFNFSLWILIILFSLVFIFIIYNQYKEGAVDASFSTVRDDASFSTVPVDASLPLGFPIGTSGYSIGGPQTSTQIQAQELVKRFQQQLVLDKNANNTLAAAADEYNINFYKSMS